MKASAGRLLKLSVWFNQRQLRDRVVLSLALLVVLFFLWDSLLLQPNDEQSKKYQKEVSSLRGSLEELKAKEQQLLDRRDYDPDREDWQRFKALQHQLLVSKAELQRNVDSLITPQAMTELLKDILSRQQELQLLSLENQPAEALDMGSGEKEKPAVSGLYRHRIEMKFTGNYLGTLAYLRELDTLPGSLVWEELEIETQKYPQMIVRLQVYTLSLKERWIGG